MPTTEVTDTITDTANVVDTALTHDAHELEVTDTIDVVDTIETELNYRSNRHNY